MTRIIRWNDPSLENFYKDKPLAIVGTAPSYDLLEPGCFKSFHVFALNAAITELWETSFHSGLHWVCHDFHKIMRYGLRQKVEGWPLWKVITRRVNIPGKFGNIPYRAVGGGRHTRRFPEPMSEKDLGRSNLWWYSELKEQEGFMLALEGVLEIALEVATFWGFRPIVLAGVDLRKHEGQAYGKPWGWKPCKIRRGKFEAMQKVFRDHRKRWPKEVYVCSPWWDDCPFEKVESLADLEALSIGNIVPGT
jgi:hypothetical protein